MERVRILDATTGELREVSVADLRALPYLPAAEFDARLDHQCRSRVMGILPRGRIRSFLRFHSARTPDRTNPPFRTRRPGVAGQPAGMLAKRMPASMVD